MPATIWAQAIMHLNDELGLNTHLAHLGEDEKIKGAVVPPIFQNSLFLFDQTEDLLDCIGRMNKGLPYHYSRICNPTVELAQKKIAQLEGTDDCLLTGSGMAAITVAVMSCVKAGAHVIAVETAYKPLRTFLSDVLPRFGVTHTLVDGRCPEEVLDAIRPETTLIYLETPSSAMFRLQDLETISKVAREKGITTMIDSTYASGVLMNPHRLGVDIVVHSATKYMGGHSDLTAGAICASQERIDHMLLDGIQHFGSTLHPFSAFLLTRGLRTLTLRMKRHQETANTIAAWLEDRPEVEVVHHLGLPSFAQRDLFRRQFNGAGGLFSFEPKSQDREKVVAFCDALKLFGRGVSWGGFESLVIPLAVAPSDYAEPRWCIRLYCGIEEPQDLLRDLEAAIPLLA